ncbi:adenosylcobinamide-GDP ribazoletransferase [Marilutibacter alkalisoli]|uniref:Adenosylcobinamide-GDP ribazoletransferase n=1 Tax=Marilutibacter alkalisoli TaxID=2591633 RepID=A0A514BU65_9GAMM|nr:adenosylcobinamide-GDP ribazoletransferase [Lysobacter alkalisoli]QDH70912.1 adenosylcobinamide-GDP ribazoletransferase [Lysobacter alkalisoli]
MSGWLGGLLAAFGFLTRIPVPAGAFARPGAQAHSLPWYPVVGAFIGLLLWGLACLLPAGAPMLVAAVVLVAWVALTGALHIDGLADSADAWVGGLGDRERTLAIMKDPRSGPAGVTAVVLVLLLKFAALATLLPDAGMALVLAPLLARATLTAAFLALPYVRANGIGTGLAGASRTACVVSLAMTAGACIVAGGMGSLALVTATLLFFAWRRACRRRLGGMTGDTCGALTELVETAVLVVLAFASIA